MWAIQRFQIQRMSPVALLLLSPWLCHPSMFLVLLSSEVQNALKTSFVLPQGALRNLQCFLALLSCLPTVMTGDKASSSYSVSRKKKCFFISYIDMFICLAVHQWVWILKQPEIRTCILRTDLCSFETFLLKGSQERLHYLNVCFSKTGSKDTMKQTKQAPLFLLLFTSQSRSRGHNSLCFT